MQDELARRAVDCEGWRWIEGMLCLTNEDGYAARILSVGLKASTSETADSYGGGIITRGCIQEDSLPDLSDPATLGCLLHLVREAWGEYNMRCACNEREWWVRSSLQRRSFPAASTEAEALVAALEAAGGG